MYKYTVNGNEYYVDSFVNQDIKTRFVDREVLCCDTSNVEYILNKGKDDADAPFSWEDVENLYPDHSEEIDELQAKLDDLDMDEPMEDDFDTYDEYYAKWKAWDDKCEELKSEIEDLEEEDGNISEIFEWWRVSIFLYEKLKNYGEPVIDAGWHYYWGRCCTGQAILLDGVISEVCHDLEILEGQACSWERK